MHARMGKLSVPSRSKGAIEEVLYRFGYLVNLGLGLYGFWNKQQAPAIRSEVLLLITFCDSAWVTQKCLVNRNCDVAGGILVEVKSQRHRGRAALPGPRHEVTEDGLQPRWSPCRG